MVSKSMRHEPEARAAFLSSFFVESCFVKFEESPLIAIFFPRVLVALH